MTLSHNVPKLNDPSLLKLNVAYVNGEWVKAKSGKTFEVFGMLYNVVLYRVIPYFYKGDIFLTNNSCLQIPHQENSSVQPPNSTPKTQKLLSKPQPQLSPPSG